MTLPVGQRICVPAVNNNNNNAITNCQYFYTIFSGDTCSNIASAFRTTLANLQLINPGLNCVTPPVGTRICVPLVGFVKSSAIAVPSIFIPSQNGCSNFYNIYPGDTCEIIASILQTNVNSLILANPTLDCQKLVRGSSICVPSLTSLNTDTTTNTNAGVAGPCLKYYSIQYQDICFNVAIRAHLTIGQFLALNPNINCNTLQIGQQVCVSNVATSTPKQQCSFSYVIQNGDTCFSLAVKYGLNLNRLASSLNCSNLQIGQDICI